MKLSAVALALLAIGAYARGNDHHDPRHHARHHPSSSSKHSSTTSGHSTSSGTTKISSSTSSSASSTIATTFSASHTFPPIPSVKPTGDWAVAISKAQTYLKKFNLTEKVDLATGVGWQLGVCVGNTPAIPAVGWPGLCLEDSPLGVRDTNNVSAFPAAIQAASTFNRDLIRQRGEAMGAEFRGKGVNVALGPMMNMGRVAAGGRNWEGFGADPYLAGEGAYAAVQGLQSQGVQACAKHLINNEQEHYRSTESSNVDDRTQHEIYVHPFLKSVQAGVASIMCSYNRINQTYACSNDYVINHILKTEIGFQGFVMSDWQANVATTDAIAGLDMTMPGDTTFGSGVSYFGPALIAAVQNGTISEARVDDMAQRIVAAWYLLGQDKNYPAPNFDAWDYSKNKPINVQDNHRQIIRTIGAAGTVLLKNVKNALPLHKPKSIAIIGNDAGPSSKGPNGYSDRSGDDGILAMGWGSGTADFPYLVDPLSAITGHATQDHSSISSSLNDSDLVTAATIAKGASVALVFLSADSGEGYLTVEGNFGDRNDLLPWHNGDALVLATAAVNPNTIVVINSVGPLILEPWIEHPNVTAVVWAGIQGQEAGNAIADVLYGLYNPSGRLPYTIAKNQSDYNTQVVYVDNDPIPQINYTEGLFFDYRHFDAAGIAPRFEFGFGLSYSTFEYSTLLVLGGHNPGKSPSGPGSSLDPTWHDTSFVTVKFLVKNTSKLAGTEIPQLYLTRPASSNSPPYVLRGFESVYLEPGQSTLVSMGLSRYDFSIWDIVQQKWVIPKGTTGITVGSSSRNHKLKGSVSF